ncbi:Low-affinity zinc transporter of the plasma membrane [Lepidopterella palustris CBS 459.81]|uniref:Low-affinity zinc transporter of the plasma membrane n=1 Tax=Lepidopterella palustris CBS 459.81 TaxID=1314670 RepID=A0A8E2JEZ6_9PEZI|nr:Low-affinity zinc transporter of the plasma membrane [Lepidopterella palustris CBS 459.81]
MAAHAQMAQFVARQVAAASPNDTSNLIGTPGHCDPSNSYNGKLGLRVSAIFVILVGSLIGAGFPVFARQHKGMGVPDLAFFIAKYFGSGIIIATAFIHLLAPASDALKNGCLTGPITEYDWVQGIVLMTIFVMFFLELMTMRYGDFGGHDHDHGHNHSNNHESEAHTHSRSPSAYNGHHGDNRNDEMDLDGHKHCGSVERVPTRNHAPGDDHLGHAREHTDNADISPDWAERGLVPENHAAQMTAIFILEFGVVFHSVFIGLTLAVAGAEFTTLYVVLVFHQTFEGLGLGSRLANVPWPNSKKWTPYLLALGFSVSTPIAIAVGLGIRNSYPPGSQTTLIVNGVFDSISAGILIYTGLVELMAHEFMFSPYMRKASIKVVLSAFGLMCLGAALMALLGKWA